METALTFIGKGIYYFLLLAGGSIAAITALCIVGSIFVVLWGVIVSYKEGFWDSDYNEKLKQEIRNERK